MKDGLTPDARLTVGILIALAMVMLVIAVMAAVLT
jgi:hypothetical protein